MTVEFTIIPKPGKSANLFAAFTNYKSFVIHQPNKTQNLRKMWFILLLYFLRCDIVTKLW